MTPEQRAREAAEKALEFYATRTNYAIPADSGQSVGHSGSVVQRDQGRIARNALSSLQSENEQPSEGRIDEKNEAYKLCEEIQTLVRDWRSVGVHKWHAVDIYPVVSKYFSAIRSRLECDFDEYPSVCGMGETQKIAICEFAKALFSSEARQLFSKEGR